MRQLVEHSTQVGALEETYRSPLAGVIDLQRILELKGLKKAETDRILDAMKDTMSSASESGKKIKKILNIG